MSEKEKVSLEHVRELHAKISELKGELEDTRVLLGEEKKQKEFYQLIADFTFGWELWLDPEGQIEYCSPSCIDLTGYTANEIVKAESVGDLLVYDSDKARFNEFLKDSLGQLPGARTFEFRIITRHRQLRWCTINIRGVYNLQGRYLGVRASVQDITRLKRALVHIHDLTSEKDLEAKAKIRIKSQLDLREREQISYLLQLSQKNEIIDGMVRKLKKLMADDPKKLKQELQKLLTSLSNIIPVPVEWQAVEAQTENLHPGFLGRLEIKHPTLTLREKKLAVYVRLGMKSREMGGLLHISPQSVEMARIRLRKKLKLTEKTKLSDYIRQV